MEGEKEAPLTFGKFNLGGASVTAEKSNKLFGSSEKSVTGASETKQSGEQKKGNPMSADLGTRLCSSVAVGGPLPVSVGRSFLVALMRNTLAKSSRECCTVHSKL